MSSNDRSRGTANFRVRTRSPTRGQARQGRGQPSNFNSPELGPLIPVNSPGISRLGGGNSRAAFRSSRPQASILQSSRQVGIHGGSFNTSGANQYNVTLNLGDGGISQNSDRLQDLSSDIAQGDRSTWDAEVEQAPLSHGANNDTAPTTRRSSYEIYYHHITAQRRGSALWIPEPSKSLPTEYRRKGVAIGDVGVISEVGSFDFLFNICLPRDHPINPTDLPESFKIMSISPTDIRKYTEFTGESSLSSKSIKKATHEGESSGLIFESSASEGAILMMPVGSNSENLISKTHVRKFFKDNAEPWYKYANNDRGWEVRNGDLRLVVGHDKTKAWGMATFSNSTMEGTSSCLLKFRPLEMSSIGRTYSWEYSGTAQVRNGPDLDQLQALRAADPPQEDIEYENQTLFVNTINLNLQAEVWKQLAFDFGEVEVDDNHSASDTHIDSNPSISSQNRPDGHELAPHSFHGSFRAIQPSRRAASAENNTGGSPTRTMGSIHLASFTTSLSSHPSNGINKMLLKLYPNAKMAITEDSDWISVLREDDSILPTAEELTKRILASRVVREEEGVVFLEEMERASTLSQMPRSTPGRTSDLNLDDGDLQTTGSVDREPLETTFIQDPMTSLFALIIGISSYQSREFTSIPSAASDAIAFKEYLENDLQVPPSHITHLLNEEATEKNIVDGFTKLALDPHIKYGDPIVIFYAGLGGVGNRWFSIPSQGNRWFSILSDMIPVLIAHDFAISLNGLRSSTIRKLIGKIAARKGDNITVVLDCNKAATFKATSSAAVSNRGSDGVTSTKDVRKPIIQKWRDQSMRSTSLGLPTPRDPQLEFKSYMLIAACGPTKPAKEHEGHSLSPFSKALLKVLRTTPLNQLRYRDVVAHMGALVDRAPQCTGPHQDRLIFNCKPSGIPNIGPPDRHDMAHVRRDDLRQELQQQLAQEAAHRGTLLTGLNQPPTHALLRV